MQYYIPITINVIGTYLIMSTPNFSETLQTVVALLVPIVAMIGGYISLLIMQKKGK